MNNLKRKVYVAVANNNQQGYNYKNICGHFQLEQDLSMDSLDRIELLMWLEEDLNIEMDSKLCDEWYIVDDVLDAVISTGGK